MKILMTTPTYFEVKDVKNDFMEGKIGTVDTVKAINQWQALYYTFRDLGIDVELLTGTEGLEDMCFSANCGIVIGDTFLASNMKHDARKKETQHYITWFIEQGYNVDTYFIDNDIAFEGGGDAIFSSDKKTLYGGYGHRTDKEAYDYIEKTYNIVVVPLYLASDDFYHLDTCFHPLDDDTLLFVPAAFVPATSAKIESLFKRTIQVPVNRARTYLAGNCFSVRKKHVVLQRGDEETVAQLRKYGFEPVEVNLSEFSKSGGNVTCLKCDI